MYHPGDRISAITLKMLRATASKNCYLRAGSGIGIKARYVLGGFELSVRRGEFKTTVVFHVDMREVPQKGSHRRIQHLICAKCRKPSYRHLYLDWDTVSALCAQCMKIDAYKHLVTAPDDYQDLSRFRRLLRQKLMNDIWFFELNVVRAMPTEELFASRPYLVPPFVYEFRDSDPVLYRKLLKALHGRYLLALRCHKPRDLKKRDAEWLEAQLQDRITSGKYYISDKENIWKAQKKLLTGSSPTHRKQSLSGSQYGTKQDQSSLPPLATDSLLSRMSSDRDMSVSRAVEKENELVTSAAETVDTQEL